MADMKNPRYIVKHVDGVMHLIPNPQGSVLPETALRSAPHKAEKSEQQK